MAERILPQVEEMAAKFGATLVLARCSASLEELVAETSTAEASTGPASPIIDVTPYVEVERDEARKYLEGVRQRLELQGVQAEIQVLNGDAGYALVDYAKQGGADLIALTSHGRGGLERLVFGSAADQVLRHATCPVLVLPVHERRGHAKATP